MASIPLTAATTKADKHTRIAGNFVIAGSGVMAPLALIVVAFAFSGFSHEPAQPGTADMVIAFGVLTFPFLMMALGAALCARWARTVAIPLVALCSLVWLLAPFFVPALILMLVDLVRERRATTGKVTWNVF